MTQHTGTEKPDDLLTRLAHAADRDEHDAARIDLASIAPQHVDALALLYEQGSDLKMSIVWSLIGQTGPAALALFSNAIRDRDQYTRWAAAEALAKFRSRAASALLVDALKDRSHLVKGTAIRAMHRFCDPRAVPQLERTVASEHLQKHAPGMIESAHQALLRCRATSRR